MISTAWKVALLLHQGQKRKYTEEPFVNHPIRVTMRVMMRQHATDIMAATAMLHDTIEDCGATPEELQIRLNSFGRSSYTVAKQVLALTNPSKAHPDLKRAERTAMDRKHMSEQSSEVKILRMYDRIDNLNDMKGAPADFAALYGEESLKLAEVIGDADEKLKLELCTAVANLSVHHLGEGSLHGLFGVDSVKDH